MTTRAANASAQALARQTEFVHQVLGVNTSGVSHEESLAQPSPGGNCLNWVVGHIVASRNQTLALLGKEPVWSEETAKRYLRGTGPIEGDAEGVVRFEKTLEAFEASQQPILDGLAEISDAELETMVPWLESEVPKSVALAGLVFHESYHLGQTGLLRRILGKEGAIR
jgi:uncharacterized damage-inducible protein DinB